LFFIYLFRFVCFPFQERVEITDLAKRYFPKWGWWITLILFNISLMSVIIASIIVSAQVSLYFVRGKKQANNLNKIKIKIKRLQKT
jgi:hypothetical protein